MLVVDSRPKIARRPLAGGGLQAGLERARHPVVQDPFLIPRMDDRQLGVVTQHLARAGLGDHLEHLLVDEAQLQAGDVALPHDDDGGDARVVVHGADRIVVDVGRQQAALLGLLEEAFAKLVGRSRCCHEEPLP
jgi:hypothetical protein